MSNETGGKGEQIRKWLKTRLGRRDHPAVQPQEIDYAYLAQGLVERTQEQFRSILGSTLIPDFVRKSLLPVVDTFSIVSEEDYVRNSENMSVLTGPVKDIAMQRGLKPPEAYGGAYYMYPNAVNPQGKIEFRQSTVIGTVKQQDDLLFLGAEEMSHALHPKIELTPLTKIKNQTLLLPKNTTMKDVKSLMKQARNDQRNTTPVRDEDIDVLRRGFCITFVDRQTGHQVHSVTHTIMEETRAAILGTALAAIYLGSAVTAAENISIPKEQQFLMGLQAMQVGALKDPRILGREGAAADFIHGYLFPQTRRVSDIAQQLGTTIHVSVSPDEVRAGINKLFRNFGTMTYNSIYATFSKAEREAWETAVKKIGDDYLANAVQSQN